MEFTIQQAQSNLSELLGHVAAGEEVIITDSEHHKPIAKVNEGCPHVD